ncbi:MAG: ribosome maturation factor RimP [Desulfocapsa sp.]|nr:MAG: ribosome maturation factor RimP [Desulfocapsa sp.]
MIEKVEEFAEGILSSLDLELVEVQYRQEGHGWVLRLFIDGPNGIGVDECAKVSREMNVFLDVEDLIPNAFHLEVSSPGLERTLRTLEDYKRFAGRKVRVKLRHPMEGQKVFIGLLGVADEFGFELILEDESTLPIQFDQVRKTRLSL